MLSLLMPQGDFGLILEGMVKGGNLIWYQSKPIVSLNSRRNDLTLKKGKDLCLKLSLVTNQKIHRIQMDLILAMGV